MRALKGKAMKGVISAFTLVLGTIGAWAVDSFESPTYSQGQALAGVNGWLAEGAVEASKDQAVEGEQSLKVDSGQKAWKLVETGEGNVQFFDAYILPAFGAGGTTLHFGGAELGFQKEDAAGRIVIFGPGEAPIANVGHFSLMEDGYPETWIRVTVRLDRSKKTWDLFLDGEPILADAKSVPNALVEIIGNDPGALYVDALDWGAVNPLFVDSDQDGMPDAEEKAYGLNAFADDRDGDLDGDGISNIREMFAGTPPYASPNNASSQSNGQISGGLGRFVFVDNLNGSDFNTGGQSFSSGGLKGPKASLKAAMAAASDEATIVLLRGTGVYEEGSQDISGKKLTLRMVEPVTIK